MTPRHLAALSALALFACRNDTPDALPPYGQLVVHVDTDAPLPAAPGDALGPDDPLPLFDRLRIEVYRPGEAAPCAECTHEFDVDRTLFRQGRASIGITPPVGAAGYVVRARLFKAAHTILGEPRPDATLDTTALLPAIAPEGITSVTIVLNTDDVAQRIGTVNDPVQPSPGAPSGLLVGTWPGARRVACVGEPSDDEVCVPGGAYWMGNPLTVLGTLPGESVTLRIASLSPFFLDKREVTVAEMFASRLATKNDPVRYDPNNGQDGQIVRCTYQDAQFDNLRLPVTCTSWETAERFCEQRGGSLPTEAQFQYVASAFTSKVFVWGDEPPTCADAVFARSRFTVPPELLCPGAWVDVPGTGRLDRLAIGGREIVDLAGNVSELALDLWNFTYESCWRPGVVHDPVCATPSADAKYKAVHARVGGSFVFQSLGLAATTRLPYVELAKAKLDPFAGAIDQVTIASTGFRCARPGL